MLQWAPSPVTSRQSSQALDREVSAVLSLGEGEESDSVSGARNSVQRVSDKPQSLIQRGMSAFQSAAHHHRHHHHHDARCPPSVPLFLVLHAGLVPFFCGDFWSAELL